MQIHYVGIALLRAPLKPMPNLYSTRISTFDLEALGKKSLNAFNFRCIVRTSLRRLTDASLGPSGSRSCGLLHVNYPFSQTAPLEVRSELTTLTGPVADLESWKSVHIFPFVGFSPCASLTAFSPQKN